jgi:protein gp37
MAANSKIEWCHHTMNFWVGCTKVSAACDHCYAEGWAKRTGQAGLWAGERRRTSAANWKQPLKWNREAEATGQRARVFSNSLADFFDNQAQPEWRADAWKVIADTPWLDWLLLTKRPQNIRKMLPPDWGDGWPNVWLGTTAENQEEADRRIPHLLATPAAVRFVSAEPLLAPIDFTGTTLEDAIASFKDWGFHYPPSDKPPPRLDWIITGGESGAHARPMHPDWARSARDQCKAAGTAYFFKQWGEFLPVGQHLPGCGKIHGATAVKPGRMKLHYAGSSKLGPKYAFADKGVAFASTHDNRLTFRVGKSRAGRLLDGREHNAMPGGSHAND